MIIIMNTGLHGDLSQISIVKYAAFTDLTQAFLVCKQNGSSLRSESDVYAVIVSLKSLSSSGLWVLIKCVSPDRTCCTLFRHSCSCSLPVKHESLLCCWRCYTYHRNIRSCSTPSDIPSEGTCNLPTRWLGIGGRDVPVLCVPSGVKTRCTPHLPATSENKCTSTSQVYRGLCDLWWKAANSFNVIGDNSVFEE